MNSGTQRPPTDFIPTVVIGPGEMYRGRFEYRIESRPRNPANPTTREDLTQWLNSFGASGWQVCAYFEDNYGTADFYFKRELP